MQHQTAKLTLIQKIAILWLRNIDYSSSILFRNIDSSLILYKLLKSLSQTLRLFLYAALIGFSYFALRFAGSLIGGYFDTAPMPGVWYFFGDIFFYGVMSGMFLILTIESVIKLDVPQILKEQKAKEANIKAKKLQFWRLRNMNISVRIVLYIIVYVICLLITYAAFLVALIDTFAITQATAETKQQLLLFEQSYETFLRWFTFIYIIGGLTLDYFVNKKRALTRQQKTTEVQNEIIAA